jgi:hypothetical protein
MSALKEVFVNVRPAVFGVISELERCKSVSEIKDLTTELRFWLDGDVMSVVNSLKSRLRGTEKPVLSTVNSASSLTKSGDTPKMIIREIEEEEEQGQGQGQGQDEEAMSGGCDSEEDAYCNRSVIDFTEADELYKSGDYKPTTTALPPTVLFSTTVTSEPTINKPVTSLSEETQKEEKVLFSTVSQAKPISVSLDISAC